MTCDWCGKEFPADARACVEGGWHAQWEREEGEEWKNPEPPTLTPENITPEMRETMKREMGLTDKELDTLLTTGHVEGLGAIVCLDCQGDG